MKSNSNLRNDGPKLCRVVWNSKGWQLPSGPDGKSSNAGNHEHDYGYGYEEWILDTNEQIDGFHYGFLQPFNQYFDLYTGNNFSDIYLYTIHFPSKKRYWVAHLRNVEVLSQAECNLTTAKYTQLGWLEEMQQQMEAVTSNKKFSGHHDGRLLNIRYKVADQQLYSKPIPINPDHRIYKLHRFKLYDATGMELPD